jgi:hypothetical protein
MYATFPILSRAVSDSFKAMETGPKAIGLALLGAAVTAVIVFIVRGKEGLRKHVVENVFIVFGGAIGTWLLIFGWITVHLPTKMLAEANSNLTLVIQEKQTLAQKVNLLNAVISSQAEEITAVRNTARSTTAPKSPLPEILPPIQPATQLDRLIAINGRMTTTDREQFAAALHDFSQALDQANIVWGRINQERGKLNQGLQTGSIASELESDKATLRQISSSAKDLAKAFPQVREKWKYYAEQIDYIFGDNPDNEGPNAIINAAEGYANYLD